jgi:hypothetical protein
MSYQARPAEVDNDVQLGRYLPKERTGIGVAQTYNSEATALTS